MQTNLPPSYYTLAELFYQRSAALAFGMDDVIDTLNVEIEAQATHERNGVSTIRPFDWERD